MKTGQVLQQLSAKDGHKVVLRTPLRKDLDDLLELTNSLLEERAEIYNDEKTSRDEEIIGVGRACSVGETRPFS